MMRARRVKASLGSMAVLLVCSAYVYMWLRYDLHGAQSLIAAVIFGVYSLMSLAFSLVRPSAYERVAKVLAGAGALVATFCAASFMFYTWTERERLSELAILIFFILMCLLALSAACAAWVTCWQFKWSKDAGAMYENRRH